MFNSNIRLIKPTTLSENARGIGRPCKTLDLANGGFFDNYLAGFVKWNGPPSGNQRHKCWYKCRAWLDVNVRVQVELKVDIRGGSTVLTRNRLARSRLSSTGL